MFEHFKGEEVFVKKVLDYLDQVQYKQRLILTQFLDPYHQSIVKSVIGHQDEVQVLENGGFIHSESQRMIIAPYFYEIEKDDFEIVVCKIVYAKNFENETEKNFRREYCKHHCNYRTARAFIKSGAFVRYMYEKGYFIPIDDEEESVK